MFLRGKKALIITTALSLFAVLVTAVSTFAWFQISTKSVDDVNDASLVKSDTSELEIEDVTAYKYKYKDISYGVTDYSDGEVVPYGSSVDIANADREDRKNADVPNEGEGYYIVGDSTWVGDCYYKKNGSYPTTDYANSHQWNYSAALRMDDDTIEGNNNIAIFSGIYLRHGSTFRVRRHYLTTTSGGSETSYQVKVHDDYINSVIGPSVSDNDNDLFDVDGHSNFVVAGDGIEDGDDGSGYYNIFFFEENSTKKMSFVRISSSVSRNQAPSRSINQQVPTRALPTSNNTIYLKVNSDWASQSARFAAYFYGNGDQWVDMTNLTGKIYKVTVPSGKPYVIFCRMNPATSTNNWNNKWNQTIGNNGLSVSTVLGYNHHCYEITGWDNSGQEAQNVTYIRYTPNNSNWYGEPINDSASNGSVSGVAITSNFRFKIVVRSGSTDYWKSYSDLVSTSKSICNDVGNDHNISLKVAGNYTFGWNGSNIYVNSEFAIVGYGNDTGDASWNYSSISTAVTLTSGQAFKIIYLGSWYGYNKVDGDHAVLIDDNCKTLFSQGNYGGDANNGAGGNGKNIKALIKGTYTFTFNTSSHVISYTTTSTSFNSLSGASTKTYYLKCTQSPSYWTNTANYAIIAYDGSGNTGWFELSSLGYDGIYYGTVTGTHTGMYFVRYGDSSGTYTIWNRTVAATPSSSADDWFMINSDDGATPRVYSGTWGTFYGEPTNDGYYLVGDLAFETDENDNPTGVTPWTFNDANALETTNLPLEIIGVYRNRYLKDGMQFKIWHFVSGSGRQGDGWATVNNDSQSTATLDDSGDNIEVRDGVEGYFDIYVTDTNKIMVKDCSEGTKLYYKYEVSEEDVENSISLSKATSTSGDSFVAVYEQGLLVTNTMASSGVYVGMVRQYAGQKTSCGTSATSYGFLGTAASTSFDGDGVDAFSCLYITKPGLYNFYWRKNNSESKIYITSRPYLESSGTKIADGDDGYYMIPYNSSTSSTTQGGSTFTNGLKMKTDLGESATGEIGNQNIAEYSRYTANANDKVFFKAFFDNRELKDSMPVTVDTTKSDLISVDSSTGVYTFLQNGTYNIYLYKDPGNSGVRTISVAKDSLTDFSTLNSIPSDVDTEGEVLAANTTLIIDVRFRLSTPANMNIGLDSIITANASGLSNFIKYAIFVDTTFTDSDLDGSISITEKYNYFRDNSTASSPYKKLKAMRSNASIEATGSYATGTHHAYIVIDYDYSQVSSMPASIVNNFYFVLKATQPSDES